MCCLCKQEAIKTVSAGQHLLLQPGLARFIAPASSRLLREAKEALPAATPTETEGITQTCKPQKGMSTQWQRVPWNWSL